MNELDIETTVYAGLDQIAETEVVARAKETPDAFPDYTSVEGIVTLVVGETRIELDDVLAYILPALAITTLGELRDSGSSTLVLYSNPDQFELHTDGTTVTMSVDYLDAPLEFPFDVFAQKSLQACRRFIDWAEIVWPDAEVELPNTKAALEQAEADFLT